MQGVDPAKVAEALRLALAEVVGPVVRESVRAALGEDNEARARRSSPSWHSVLPDGRLPHERPAHRLAAHDRARRLVRARRVSGPRSSRIWSALVAYLVRARRVSALVAYLVTLGAPAWLTDALGDAGPTLVVPFVLAAVYALLRWAEPRLPAPIARVLLGSARPPTYTAIEPEGRHRAV
ncbi:hypothetical protein AB0L13_46670 [Saccharopolyspora shandongensis]|uniref:hypothetical protein n=1 Tax=Saccharopolyspora shandongensis TaxID=418495 RepID=UPI00342C872E